MDATKRWDADQRKEDFGAPLPGAPNVGYRVLAKPLRFELSGVHEDLLPTEMRPEPRCDSKPAR